MDPVSGGLMPWPILTDGLKEDHPEWFEDEEQDEDEDEKDQELDDRWGGQSGGAR